MLASALFGERSPQFDMRVVRHTSIDAAVLNHELEHTACASAAATRRPLSPPGCSVLCAVSALGTACVSSQRESVQLQVCVRRVSYRARRERAVLQRSYASHGM